MKINFCLLLVFLLNQTAFGQSKIIKVYHIANSDSSVSILGENHGFAPYTISLSVELVNMRSTKPMPAKFVISPSQEPVLLATLIPNHQHYSFRYKSPYQIGIYTGYAPDTSYVYSLPFKLGTDGVVPPCSVDNTSVPGNLYPCFFSLSTGAVVCAARAGIVVAVRQDVTKTKGPLANFIIVYHEDGGMAWYQNLQKNTVYVKMGQRVAVGDTLGLISGEKQHPPLYFNVEYPGERRPQAVPVTFRIGDKFFRPHHR